MDSPLRALKHLFAPDWIARRAFTPDVLKRIERAIKTSEQAHDGELRFAVEASLPGCARSNKASVPHSAAASDSRRTATGSIAPWRISPMTAPMARQRKASSIAHSRSRLCATLAVSSRSGAQLKRSSPGP